MKDIIIIGAGGVGRETALIIEQINEKKPTWNIIGFLDDNEKIWNSEINGYRVMGGLKYLNNLEVKPYVIIAIANYKVKKSIVDKLENKFKFATIVHPDIYLNRTINIGDGSIIYPGVIMTTNISIGDHVIVSPKCGIGHDSIIRDYVSLLWNVNISGFDIIEEGALIGSGATIIQEKTVAKGSIIGAGAVVIRDIDENSINVGVPSIKLS
ncbi:NeuD/PglB/VioB family sugar acetyltransferase [uncultured Clostridium sp.]|uniref:NeuD/PglB/VioB family sugar acetyltransferase n=1 Tax=uncultured Clostridium sp. TaxID=59620 RepID=UPI0026283E9A|nr:NeuD/PglB/VioB family sugar acetyltransferase [uncultured Clostridium sp.]